MEGSQAYVLGLRNLDKFSYIGQFSAGIMEMASSVMISMFPE